MMAGAEWNLLDKILEVLEDGEWHSVKQIESTTNVKQLKILVCLRFLEHFHFIEIDRPTDRVKATKQVKDVLDELKKLDE